MRSKSLLLIAIVCSAQISCHKQSSLVAGPLKTEQAEPSSLEKELTALGFEWGEELNSEIDLFSQSNTLYLTQPIDHTDPSKGRFKQKLFISHKDFESPMVMYLSGYNSPNNKYVTEPALMLQANQLHVEHRFFGDSAPKDIPWEYLTIEQAAADHHRIVQLLKQLYPGPWLNTGISKGGQTVMYHKAFYPDDVDASVVYVAPLNQALQDPRIEQFLYSVGSEDCRNKVLGYQLELLLNYNRSLDLFKEFTANKGYEYGVPVENAFELSVFEYGFAFWQWNADCASIPDASRSLEEKMEHLFTLDAPGFFTSSTMSGIYPFFYQSYTQMGMYGYDVDPFSELTQVYKEDVDNYETFIPEDKELEFDGTTHKWVRETLDKGGNDMIFIYGGNDPWSATAYEPTTNTNAIRFTIEGGNHASRMAHLSPEEFKQAKDSLIHWMGLEE